MSVYLSQRELELKGQFHQDRSAFSESQRLSSEQFSEENLIALTPRLSPELSVFCLLEELAKLLET